MAISDRETLVALRGQLVAAEGASKELDTRIWVALFPKQRVMLDGGSAGRVKRAAVYGTATDLNLDAWGDYEGLAGLVGADPVTGSVDAAVFLFMRMLPNWSRESGRSGFGNPAWCRAWNPLKSPGEGNSIRAEHNGGCEPIAILIALIDALTSEPANAR